MLRQAIVNFLKKIKIIENLSKEIKVVKKN